MTTVIRSCIKKIIALVLLHTSGFSIMALFAKRLPITLVPKQNLVSPVRSDMINNGCRSQFSDPFALYTKGVLFQKSLTYLLPPTVITTFKGVLSIVNMKFGMLFAVLIIRQSRTTRMLAWFLRSFRHIISSKFLLEILIDLSVSYQYNISILSISGIYFKEDF